MSADNKENFYKLRNKVCGMVKTNVVFEHYLNYLDELLARARDEYEGQPASEHLRGRVSMLKDLISELRGN